MKNSLRFFIPKTVFIILMFCANSMLGQATFNSAGTGNWTDSSKWTVVTGSDADGIPDANDIVNIISNHTITVNTGSQACASLTIGPSSNTTSTLAFSSGTTLTVSDVVTLGTSGNMNRNGRIVMTNGGTLVCEGFVSNNAGSNFAEGAGTVILTATNTLPSTPATLFSNFFNLTISAGTTTTSSAVSIGGAFDIASGAALATGATNSWTLGVTGATSVTGTLTLANTGSKTFTGNVIVNSAGTWNETNAAAIGYSGSLQNDGTFTASTGTHTFSGTNKSISGSNGIAVASLTINGTTTNNTTLSVSTTLNGSSTLTNAAAGILNFGGSAFSGTVALVATAAGNIVNYNGASQTVKHNSYSNLILSGSGVKTFSSPSISIGETLTIDGTARADFANTTTNTANALTLGGYAQSSGTWGGTGSGAANINTSYFDPSTNGRVNVGTGSCTGGLWLGATSTNWNTAGNWCGGVPTSATDVVILPGTAFQPSIPASTTAVCKNMTITSGATLTMAASSTALLNVGGNFTNDGTLTAGAGSTVSFIGSGAQALGGNTSTAFANLTVNTTTSAITVTNSTKAFTASGNLTVTQGNFITEATDANYTVSGNVSVAANGTWTHNVDWDVVGKQFTVGGNIAIDGAYAKGAAGRSHVQMTGSGKTVHTGTSMLNILTLNTTGAITADGPMTVDNNFWAMIGVAGGSFSTNGQTVIANGALLNSGGTININGGSLTVTGGINCGMNPGLAGNIVLSSGTLTTDAFNIGASGAVNGAFSQTGGTLNVNGNVTMVSTTPASTFTCTNSPAINISGNWINNGIYTKATETVTFNGTTAISGSSTNSFHNVTITGALTAPSGTMNVSGTWTNDGTFTHNSGTVVMNGSSQQTLAGSAATTFNNLTVSNTAGALFTADQNVNNTLSMTGGNINIGTKNLTMGATAPAISGTFTASRMIIADGGGQVRKSATSNATAAYTFPIGDNTGTAEYTPLAISAVTGSGYSSATIGVSVGDAKHPNNASGTNYLTRYWNVTQTGITSCVATVNGTYLNTAADVAGTLGSIRTAQLDGTFNQGSNPWVKTGGNVLSGTTLTYTNAALTSGQASSFTGITSANPTASITGGGITVCQNATATLTAVPVGDAAFTYAWAGSVSGSATNSTATPNTAVVGGPNAYTVIVKDGNGIASAASASVNVTVAALPVAGVLTPSPAAGTVCAGTSVSATAAAGSGGTGTIADELEVSLSSGSFIAYTSGASINTTGQTSVTIRTRRTATGSGCTTSGYNTVTWTMNAVSVGGSISGAATVCSGTNSTILTLNGNVGTIQWQSSSDNVTFNNISGQTGSTYTATNLTATTYYRAIVTSGVCSSATTPSVTMTVSPVSVAGSISGATTVCLGANSTVLTLSGNVGTIQWQSSSDNVTFNNISGQTGSTYTATNLTATTYYRAVVTSGVCSSATTFGSAVITVNPVSVAGSISGATTVCSGVNSTVLTLNGNVGTIQWQSSTDNITFNNIGGQTSATYTATNLTSTTHYRAVVTSGVCSSATTASVTMIVNPTSVAGSLSADQAVVCSGTNSTVFTLSGNTGTIQWQSSPDDVIFTNIAGATAQTYTATNLTATTYYKAVVTSGVCSSSATPSLALSVNPASVAGSIAGAGTVCPGSDLLLTLSGNTGTIQWQSSSDNVTFTNIPGATSATYNVVNVTGTAYYRAVVTSGVCSSINTVSVTVGTGSSTIWDGTAWSNGAPTSTGTATITGNYTSAANGGSINACTLTVNNNAAVVISSGDDVSLYGALTVSSGSFTLENNANLLQATNAANTGNIIVKRNSSALKRLDYTLWSAPVDGQDLKQFSPATLNDRFYVYNTATNLYNSIAPAGTNFAAAKGYLIRMPNNHPTFAWTWNGQFAGAPHNGPYTFTMADGGSGFRFNLAGNPYPSPIDIEDFVAANASNITGTLYFWRKTNNTLSPSYCSWAAGTFTTDGEAQVFNPQGIIQTGQGFFVESTGNGSALNFDNSMRVGNHANQFFRSANVQDKSRIWLNAGSATGAFSQMALVYVDGADSNAVDPFDGRYINDGDIALNSMIDNVDYVIQGRAPFEASDVVPLDFRATSAGSYTISIDHVDGLFSGNQNIYLKDNLTGAITDLKAGAYSFASEAGSFTGRFEVIYQLPLGVTHPEFNESNVVIYKHEGGFVINSGNVTMDNVKVFDIRGRLLTELKAVNASQAAFNIGETNEVLIVKITSDDHKAVTKKVVN